MKELPEGSKAHSELERHLEWQIMRLRESEGEGQRNWFGFGVGLTLAVGLSYLAVFLFSEEGWWRWLGVLALLGALFGLVGIFASLTVEKRGDKAQTSS
ncbi:hypothetical protein [Saccharopolyspora sp. NPDC049357]|uniref:hypothetical protein n=1 Tax=Saccharopolyspora sp. NPDC049357 TaxID=3154507 RepID=UPI00342999EB